MKQTRAGYNTDTCMYKYYPSNSFVVIGLNDDYHFVIVFCCYAHGLDRF